MKIFLAAVRKWEMLAASKVKSERQWKKSEQEHKEQNVFEQIRLRFLHKPYARFTMITITLK